MRKSLCRWLDRRLSSPLKQCDLRRSGERKAGAEAMSWTFTPISVISRVRFDIYRPCIVVERCDAGLITRGTGCSPTSSAQCRPRPPQQDAYASVGRGDKPGSCQIAGPLSASPHQGRPRETQAAAVCTWTAWLEWLLPTPTPERGQMPAVCHVRAYAGKQSR